MFHILEHARVHVVSRAYPCLKPNEIKTLTGGGPRSPAEIGGEIDSFLEEELPGADLALDPNPRGLDATITHPPTVRAARATFRIDLDPDGTFVPETYDRAAAHVQELYRNEGYLHAEVGPVHVLRRQCDQPLAGRPLHPGSLPLRTARRVHVRRDEPPAAGRSARFVVHLHARSAARRRVRAPSHAAHPREARTAHDPLRPGLHRRARPHRDAPGPRYRALLGEPANTLKLEDARRKLLELYKEEGYVFADVKYTLESSPDHTRARVRFDVVEGDQVDRERDPASAAICATNDGTIRRRIALELGKPYRTSLVRKTQERIATLNVFSNVNVALEDAVHSAEEQDRHRHGHRARPAVDRRAPRYIHR